MPEAPASAFTGRLCHHDTCRSAADVARLQLDWRGLLDLQPPGGTAAGANVQAGGSSCRPQQCRPLALDPWAACSNKTLTEKAKLCVMPNAQCGISCSGSIGEESFALIALLALRGGRLNHTDIVRPWGSPRQRPVAETTCAGTRSLPRGGTYLEIGANNGFASNTRYLEECLGWRGLLIEGHPQNFAVLKRRPRSLTLASAVCNTHGTANFSRRAGPTTGLMSEMSSAHRARFRHSRGPNGTMPVDAAGFKPAIRFAPELRVIR